VGRSGGPGPAPPVESRPVHARDVDASIREALASGGADDAATLAIEAHGPALLGYLAAMLPPDDARDAFSLFAEDLWKGLAGFRWECSLRAWLYRLAFHAAGRLRRDGYRQRREPMPESMASRLAASVISTSGFQPGSRRDRLAKLRAQLDLEENTLLTLRVDREMEWEEVAEVLAGSGEDVTPATLRKRYERLKEKLGEMAKRHGLLDDDDGNVDRKDDDHDDET